MLPLSSSSSFIAEGDDTFFFCFFWKAEGDVNHRPLLFVLFYCSKKKKAMTAKLSLPSFFGFFWKAEGCDSCRPLLFVLFCCSKKNKKAMTALLPSPSSLVFLEHRRGW